MAVIKFLHSSAQLSDGVCRLVAREFSDEVLLKLFELDAYLPRPSKDYVNSLYLHLMSDAPFKRRLARVYAMAFPTITTSFQRGFGLIDNSIYSLSVQFLNRAMFVIALREERDFYRVLASGLYRSLVFSTNGGFMDSFLDANEYVNSSRRSAAGDDNAGAQLKSASGERTMLRPLPFLGLRMLDGDRPPLWGPPLRHEIEFLSQPLGIDARTGPSGAEVGGRAAGHDFANEFIDIFAPQASEKMEASEKSSMRTALSGLDGGSFQTVGDVQKWVDGLFDEQKLGCFYLADRMAFPHPAHWVLRFRRYIPIMSDLKCILTVPGVARCFWADAGPIWLRLLSLAQGVHPQRRQRGSHVEFEEDHWMFAFNLFISLNASFEGLLSWLGETNPALAPEPEADAFGEKKRSSDPPRNGGGLDALLLCSLADETSYGSAGEGPTKKLLRYVHGMEERLYGGSSEPAQCLCSIGAALARDALTLAMTGERSFVAVPALNHLLNETSSPRRWICLSEPRSSQSFHIPLHRFWAAALRQAARVTQVHALQAGRLLPRLGEGYAGCWEILVAHVDAPPALLLGLCAVCVARRGQRAADVDRSVPPREKIRSLKALSKFHNALADRADSPLKSFWEKYGSFADASGDSVELPPSPDRHRFLQDLDRAYIHAYSMPLVGDIIEEVLRVVVMASQISSGMWRRNGMSIQDQVNNYGEGLFFKIFRDLDVIALQFAALLYGPDAFVSHVVHRFGLFGILSEDCYGSQPHDLGEQDAEYAIPLLENMLQFLIVLATELPQPPEVGSSADDEGEMMQFEEETRESTCMKLARREMVHKLAAKNRTHSELSDCSSVFRSEPLSHEQVTSIIKDIAVEKGEDDLLAALNYELKPELWAEYDPCYYHLTRMDHQAAMSRKPAPKKATPMCPPPPACHPLFAKFRCDLLSCDSIFLILHAILQRTRPKAPDDQSASARSKRPLENDDDEVVPMEVERSPNSSSADGQKPSAPLYSELVELRCVQLLTLALQVESRECSDVYGSDGGEGGDRGFFARIAAFRGGELIEILARMETLTQDVSMKHAVRWLLKTLEKDEHCQAIVTRIRDETQGAKKSKAKARSRAKLAQQRAVERMKKRAMQFARSYTEAGEEGGNEAELESDLDDERAHGDPCSDPAESLECIICRAATDEPLHFVGFCERARVRSLHPQVHFSRGTRDEDPDRAHAAAGSQTSAEESSPERLFSEDKTDDSSVTSETRKEPGDRKLDFFARDVGVGSGLFLQGCGHPLHLSCFSTYSGSSSGRAVHHLLVEKGEFSCPLCQQVGNVLIPNHPQKAYGSRKTASESLKSEEDALSPEGIQHWLEEGLSELAHGYRSLADDAAGRGAMDVEVVEPPGGSGALASPSGMPRASPRAAPRFTEDTENQMIPSPSSGDEGSQVQIISDSVGLTFRFVNSLWSVWKGRDRVVERGVPRVTPNCVLSVCKLLGYTARALEAELGLRTICNTEEYGDARRRISARNPGLGLTKRIEHTKRAFLELRVGIRNLPMDFRARLLELLQMQMCPSPRQEEDEKDLSCKDGWVAAKSPYTVLLESPLGVLLALLCVAPADGDESLSLSPGSDGSISEAFVRHAVSSTWLITLWQICLSELHGHVHGVDSAFAAPGKCLRLLDPENASSQSSLLAFLRQVTRSSYSAAGDLMQCSAESLMRFEERVHKAFGAHLRSASIMLLWLAPEQYHAAVCAALSSTAGEELALKEMFGVPNIEAFLESLTFMEWNASWARSVRNNPLSLFMGRPLHGEQSSLSALNIIAAMGFLHGLPRPALIELPGDYTELHARFTLRQALCLVCGEVMVVDGTGSASAHAELCGCGQGIFYLIREGHVLLIHGSKAAYFPSPYVDSYGERHRKFRTIPLKLEPRRWEAVQRLWAQHGISVEVAHQRSTARQVIVDSWY
uniref:E3 ubiquitin-protein ligase n=1 Tax=Pinguiococcus pyrenoidosus TaxID=172671 RepID=A0A7R9U7G2_9STRA